MKTTWGIKGREDFYNFCQIKFANNKSTLRFCIDKFENTLSEIKLCFLQQQLGKFVKYKWRWNKALANEKPWVVLELKEDLPNKLILEMLLFERSNITRPVHSFKHPRSKIPERNMRWCNIWPRWCNICKDKNAYSLHFRDAINRIILITFNFARSRQRQNIKWKLRWWIYEPLWRVKGERAISFTWSKVLLSRPIFPNQVWDFSVIYVTLHFPFRVDFPIRKSSSSVLAFNLMK